MREGTRESRITVFCGPTMARNTRWPMVLFVVALVLYLPGIWWGLPEGTTGRSVPWGPDELGPVGAINEVYGVFAANNPTFNPQYPLFHYLTELVTVGPYYAGLWATGHISTPAPSFPYGLDHPAVEVPMLTLLARLPSIFLAAGVVVIAFLTGRVLANPTMGVIAASVVMFQYTMFYYARTSNVDMGALFWTALGLYVFAVCLIRGVTTRRWMAFGVLAALATATKDPCYAAFLPAGAVILVLHLRQTRRTEAGPAEVMRALAKALAAAVVVYLMASGLIFRPSRFEQHIEFITTGTQGIFYFRYPPTVEGYGRFLLEFMTQLVDATGVPALAAVAAGVAWWTLREPSRLLWLLPAVGVFAGVILPVRFALLRFVMIITYVGAFAAADLLSRGWLHYARGWRTLARAAVILVVGWSALRGADLTWQMMFDGRQIAAVWLGEVTRPGDRVGHVVRRQNQLPNLRNGVETLEMTPTALKELAAGTGPEFIVSMPLHDYEHVHELDFPADTYQRLMNNELGYRNAGVMQRPRLFDRRPAGFVNPPVRVFVREDIWRERGIAPLSGPAISSGR